MKLCVAVTGSGQHLKGGSQVGDTPRQRALDDRQLHADRGVLWPGGGRIWDASKRGLQHADTAALGRPAERSEPIVAEPQRTHAGREGNGLAATGGAWGS